MCMLLNLNGNSENNNNNNNDQFREFMVKRYLVENACKVYKHRLKPVEELRTQDIYSMNTFEAKLLSSWHKLIWGLCQNHMHIFRPCWKCLQSFKRSLKVCRRSCAHRICTIIGERNHGSANTIPQLFSEKAGANNKNSNSKRGKHVTSKKKKKRSLSFSSFDQYQDSIRSNWDAKWSYTYPSQHST